MQTAETRNRDDLPQLGWLCGPMNRRVLAQRQVHSILVVPAQEVTESPSGVSFIQHDDLVEALASKRAAPAPRRRSSAGPERPCGFHGFPGP